MNDIETAAGPRSVEAFPASWGTPPHGLEERTRWIQQNIRAGDEALDRGERLSWKKPHTSKQMLASLRWRRESPAFANATRLQLVELLKRGPV